MNETLFEWDDSFLIGIEELDHEHKRLIEDINRLHAELARRQEKPEIEKCLGDIWARMQAHFALEEHVMKEHGYRYFNQHKREHDELLDSYTESMTQFLSDTTGSASQAMEAKLKHWVIDHIATSDKKMSLMVKNKKSYKEKYRT